MYAGIMPPTQAFLVRYPLSAALPTAEETPWTAITAGSATASVADGVLALTCPTTADSLRWWLAETDFTNANGVVLQAAVKVSASSSGADKGFLLEVRDGECQFTVFLRADGLNVGGFANLAHDHTDDFHVVSLYCKGIDCALYLDGILVQSGTMSGLTDDQRIGFGTAQGYGYATAEVAWLKARAFYSWETMPDGGFLMTIGPYNVVVEDLPAYDALDAAASLDPDDSKCCWRVVEVDHSSVAEFSFAEPPIIAPQPGVYEADLSENDILISVLGETDGGGFKLLIMNMGFATDLGYETATADIPFSWTRRGLVTV